MSVTITAGLTIWQLLTALAAAAGTAKGISAGHSGDYGYDESFNEALGGASSEVQELWNSLTNTQKDAIVNQYYKEDDSFWGNLATFGGLLGDERRVLDTDALLSDLATSYDTMAADYQALKMPIYDDYLKEAREQIASENQAIYRDLDDIMNKRVANYNDQLRGISDDYRAARADLLSQNYQQNAQLMDTMQSGMERSRRNALEAGASAGIRIADNINTLLSVQNKQSATSMETANQLTQMMIGQRNAERSIRNDYTNALSEDASKRHDLQLSSHGRANELASTNYNSAYNSYAAKEEALDRKYSIDNPLYGYRDTFKSKYKNNTQGAQ